MPVLAGLVGFVLHEALFAAAATKVTNALDEAYKWHLVYDVSSAVNVNGVNLPGVDPHIRVWTSVKDTLELGVLAAVAACHLTAVTSRRPPLAQLEKRRPASAEPSRGHYYLLSGLATQVRMGDAFAALEVTSFWTPLLVFALGRLAAYAVGLVPGMPSGGPSITTQMVTGYVFAGHRAQLRARLAQLQEPLPPSWSTSFVEDWLCYAWCCCFVAAEDALAVDEAAGVAVRPPLRLEVVGEPVGSGRPLLN